MMACIGQRIISQMIVINEILIFLRIMVRRDSRIHKDVVVISIKFSLSEYFPFVKHECSYLWDILLL